MLPNEPYCKVLPIIFIVYYKPCSGSLTCLFVFSGRYGI